MNQIKQFIGITIFILLVLWFATDARASGSPELQIPALHISSQVGIEINDGPAWWPNTSRPGSGETVAIASHRTTHGGPFRYIDRLQKGNIIQVRWGNHLFSYRVTGSRVEPASNLHIADDRGHELLILTSCSRADRSPTSASYRLVVYALPFHA